MARIALIVGLAALLVVPFPVGAATPDQARYDISLTTLDGVHWTGTQKVTFTNTGELSSHVYLRLWGNGVSGCATPAVKIRGMGKDCTVARLDLEPLSPGESTTVEFDLTIDVPDSNNRLGRIDGRSYLGNAVPVLAVNDELPPYVDDGEPFHSLTSDFRAELSHPVGMDLPATGKVTAQEPGVTTIEALDVRDFAWAAGDFNLDTVTTASGVVINSWVHAGHACRPDPAHPRCFEARGRALLRTVRRLRVARAGPGDRVGLRRQRHGVPRLRAHPGRAKPTVHEIGHQWFYGMIGNDQYHHPWLDEGLTEYATVKFLYSWDPVPCTPEFPSTTARIDSGMDYFAPHIEEYHATAYVAAACMVVDIERAIGPERTAALLRDFSVAQRFGVATPAEFRAAAQVRSNIDLTPFWRRWRNTGQ